MDIKNWNAGHEHDAIFRKFCLELQNWCRTGKEPEVGNQDMKYYLDLQEKRLKEHGLTLELQIQSEQNVQSARKIANHIPIFGNEFSRFKRFLYIQDITRTSAYFKEGKRLFKKNEYLTMYQTILDPDRGDKNIGRSTYVCPNCGAISTLEVLQDTGCPYCGTRYLMKDLYPKVTNYYFIDTGFKPERKWRSNQNRILITAGCISLIQTVYTLLTDSEFELPEAIVAFPLYFGFLALVIYILYSFLLLFRHLIQAGKAMPLVGATAGSKSKITQKLSAFDPAFDYEYFEGKALSLARILMLSQRPDDCVQYQGPPLSDRFSDIVDIQYRGGIGVRSIRKKQDRIEVNLNLFLTNTLDRGGKLRQKDEKIQISMYHNAAFPVDETFSIAKVQCPNCGSSFDARKEKNCPYCGQAYDAGINDWIVTKISR